MRREYKNFTLQSYLKKEINNKNSIPSIVNISEYI